MNRPLFNRFADGDPREDFNNRMRVYLVHLEENQMGDTYRQLIYMRDEHLKNYRVEAEKNRELRQTLKTLRSQIKAIYKEHHGYKKTAM